jgi:4-amino-4-deoxy-L-arabinose transferase-like glycosyltransferase
MTRQTQIHIISVITLLGIALAGRWHIAALDFHSVLSTYLADDAFYYFKVAANLVTSHRITYDGEGLTNGFHPLWLIFITPFYTAANNGEDFVARVQWIMLLIQLASVALLYLSLLRIKASWWITFTGTAMFALHSSFIDFQFNGLETSLNTLVLLGLFNAFLTLYTQPTAPTQRYLFFGCMAAAAFLARTDNAIPLLILFPALLWTALKVKRLQCLILSGLLALALVSPWLIWNQLQFGSMIQTSGKVETALFGEPHFSWMTLLAKLVFSPLHIFNFTQELSHLFVFPRSQPPSDQPAFIQPLFAIGILASWFYSVAVLLVSRRSTPALQAVALFSIAVLLVFFYNAGIRSFVRTWYYISAMLAILMALYGLAVFAEHNHNVLTRRAAHISMAAWLVSVIWLHWPGKLADVVTGDSPHKTVANWIDTHTDESAVIGSMNSGILSYLTHRKVINLDGVMDLRSLQAHWQKNETAYVHERGINYLVDNDGALQLFCAPNPYHECETVFSFGDPKHPNKVVKLVLQTSGK